jgi:hypothetical protein
MLLASMATERISAKSTRHSPQMYLETDAKGGFGAHTLMGPTGLALVAPMESPHTEHISKGQKFFLLALNCSAQMSGMGHCSEKMLWPRWGAWPLWHVERGEVSGTALYSTSRCKMDGASLYEP